MRKEGLASLLALALELRATRLGLTLADIEGRFAVSRRTAERMRATIEAVFPGLEQANPGELPKRWRLPPGTVERLADVSLDELQALESAATLLRHEAREDDARRLFGIARKLRAAMRADALRQVEPDLEALSVAEGLAMRCGPRQCIDPEIMARLRTAVLALRKVRLHYMSRTTGRLSRQLVCPYGFLYGTRHYLVAYSMNPHSRGYRMFALANIRAVEETDWSFVRREDFSVAAYAMRSFGVYQEEPFETIWRFSPASAAEARTFLFHPSQEMSEGEDGSLTVRFRASGATEMCWHLFTWGKEVEVLEPEWLARKYQAMLDDTRH